MSKNSRVNNIKSSFHSKHVLPASLELYKNNCERVAEWKDWLEFTNSHVLVFRNVKDDGKVMVLDWLHRWKPNYMKNVKKRFKIIADLCESYNFIHMVLTVQHFGDIGYYMRMLKRAWKLLHDLLTKRYGKFMYVAVLEPHRDGYPHLHVLIFCDFFLIDQKELSRYVKSKGIGKICYIKRYWANRYGKKPIYYLAKYLGKYWNKNEWTDSFIVFSSYLWKTRTRSLMFSRGFGIIIVKNKAKEKHWVLWFVCEIDDLEYLLNQANCVKALKRGNINQQSSR
jgi:hypothetical protein